MGEVLIWIYTCDITACRDKGEGKKINLYFFSSK